MYAYLLATQREVSPFGRPPAEMKIHNTDLVETQCHSLEKLGYRPQWIDHLSQVDQFPCLLIHDDLYFTHFALVGFLKAVRRATTGRRATTNWQAALRSTPLTERYMLSFQGKTVEHIAGERHRVFDCYYLNQLDARQKLEQQTSVLPIPHRTKRLVSRVNRHFDATGHIQLPLSLVYMSPISHWANLVAANLLGMPALLARTAQLRPWAIAGMLSQLALRSSSLRPLAWLAKSFLAGRRCRVHPSAHVEGSVLGERVKVGPHAVVRGCIIGDRTEIGPGAVVDASSLGSEVAVAPNTVTRACVVGDGANLGSLFLQLSVIGPGAVTCPGSGVMDISGIADFSPDGTVPIRLHGQTVPSGWKLLGGCMGDDSFLGAGVGLLCGRELPNRCVLVRNPRDGVHDVNRSLPAHVLRLDRHREPAPSAAFQVVRAA